MPLHLKPKLLDPLLQRKIINTLNPQTNNWILLKSASKDFYDNYIYKNMFLIILVLLLLLFLFYRYRITKLERTREMYYALYTPENNYSKQIINMYDLQKEYMREPEVGKMSRRVINPPMITKPEFNFYEK